MGIFRLSSSLGVLGEDIGCRYLEKKGYSILQRNYCNNKGKRLGEIDIVACLGKEIVFFEVKTRMIKKETMVFPEENITPRKLRRLERIARQYLLEKKMIAAQYHFDALSIVYDDEAKKAHVRHLEHIFF
ncbi:MAG: YraN family protein [Candidatus Moranbacteria bacterium]|nr:YraN family protein [Candidatus Moranbacteria bacterium]